MDWIEAGDQGSRAEYEPPAAEEIKVVAGTVEAASIVNGGISGYD